MKKLFSVILACLMVFSLAACTNGAPKAEKSSVKAGFIFLHDENSTYDLNFINAAKEACDKLGVECVLKTNIPEGQECYEAACELADAGCDIVFADSFGHEDYLIEAAKEYKDVDISYTGYLNFSPYKIINPLMYHVMDGGVQLTDLEKAQLKAFLNTLTDEKFLNNPDYSKP